MGETLNLDDYREMLAALDGADFALAAGAGLASLNNLRETATMHLGRIRDAVENCLYRDHGRLGFASEKGDAPASVRPAVCRQVKLTPDDTDAIRRSSGPARLVAERFGVSISRVSEIRRGFVHR